MTLGAESVEWALAWPLAVGAPRSLTRRGSRHPPFCFSRDRWRPTLIRFDFPRPRPHPTRPGAPLRRHAADGRDMTSPEPRTPQTRFVAAPPNPRPSTFGVHVPSVCEEWTPPGEAAALALLGGDPARPSASEVGRFGNIFR